MQYCWQVYSVFLYFDIVSFTYFICIPGFGLLEAGCINSKNEVNILVKNAIDVVFGGITYWAFGYGLSFGEEYHFIQPTYKII